MPVPPTLPGCDHHWPFAVGAALPSGRLPFQIMVGGGVAALALPRLLPVEMPLGCPPSSELDVPCWPPPSAVLSATGGVGAGVLSVGAVGAGVVTGGAGVAESPNPPKPCGLPSRPRPVAGCVSALATAVGAGVTAGGV